MGERYSLLYRYSIDGMETWTDFTDIVDSSKTKVTMQLCSTECKSIKDKASLTLPSQDSELKSDFIKAMLEEYEIYVQIFDLEPLAMNWEGDAMLWDDREMLWKFSTAIFTGVVDKKSSTTIKSFPFTPSVTLSLQDLSSLKLDDNVDGYVFLEDSDTDRLTVTKVVRKLLDMAGCAYTSDSIKASEEAVLPCFVIDKDDAKTYREYIDTLLFEVGGYVLDFDQYGRAKIVRLPWDDCNRDDARTIDNPTVADGVSTKFDYLDADGVKLTWSTLAESSKDQIVYQDSISRSVEGGALKGEEVPSGGYWPEDGDIAATYQAFSADFLDTPYLIGDSRKKNEDLSIVAVRDVYATIQATDAQGDAFDGWEYPILPSLGMEKNPTIYPTKAWYLLRNGSGGAVDLQFFTLRGRVLYRNAVNEDTTPATASKPKGYTSTYIYTKAHAQRFSQFYWHYLNTTRYVTTFTEINRGYLGETVRINHKGVEYGQDAMVVSQEITWLNRKTKKITATAIAVSAYNEYESSSSSRIPGRKERGNGIQKVENAYCVTQTQDRPGEGDFTSPTPPPMSSTDKYLWQKTTITYTDPSFPPTVTITLISVYGDDGDPALVCSITCDKSHVTRNDRCSDSVDYIFTIDVQGYTETYTVCVDDVDKTSDIVDGKLTIKKAYKQATSIEAKIIMDGAVMSSIALDVIDETGGAVYLGELSATPQSTADGGLLLDGDYFIAAAAFTEDDDTYEKGVPYVRQGGLWKELESTDAGYAEKMLQCLGGALNSGIAVPSSTALYGWFENLVAQNAVFATLASNEAFIKLLNVLNLIISNANGFDLEIRSTDSNGTALEKPIFKVSYDANTVFQIDAQTGNVFLGTPDSTLTAPKTGFMYRANDKSIVTNNGKFQILDNGTILAVDGYYRGSFDCEVIKTSKVSNSSLSSTLSTLTNRQAYVLATFFSDNDLGEGFYQCTLSGLDDIAYVKFFKFAEVSKYSHVGSIIVVGWTDYYTCQGVFAFYDKHLNEVDVSSYVSGEREPENFKENAIPKNAIGSSYETRKGNGDGTWTKGVYFTAARTLTLYIGSDLLFVDLPVSSANLPSGAVYIDGDTANLKVVI